MLAIPETMHGLSCAKVQTMSFEFTRSRALQTPKPGPDTEGL